MNWKNVQNGYEFRIYYTYAQRDEQVIKTIKLDLNDTDFEKYYQVLTHLQQGIEKHYKGYTDDVAKYISQNTGFSEEEMMKMIDPIVFSDPQFEDLIAQVSYIELFKFENGTVQYVYLNNEIYTP